MKYVKIIGDDTWHEPDGYSLWFESGAKMGISVRTPCLTFTSEVDELINECHLPEDAKLCKHCFPEEKK